MGAIMQLIAVFVHGCNHAVHRRVCACQGVLRTTIRRTIPVISRSCNRRLPHHGCETLLANDMTVTRMRDY